MAKRKGISTGTTAQRSIEEAGHLRFNTTTSLLEYYDGSQYKAIDAPPTVTSISPSNVTSGDGTGNYTIVVTGSGFSSTVTAQIVASDGATIITPDTTTRDSATQVTLVVAKNKSNLTNANEPFDIKIINSSGLTGTLADALTIDAQPIYSTAAGSLGTIADSTRASTTLTVVAADPESGGDVTYSLESGSLPAGATLTSTSSGGVITGFNAVGSNTTSTFTIRAKDVNSNVSDREFTITVLAPVITSFTSSGTFSVPSGVTSVDVLVVGGGGSGGKSPTNGGGGGGAGGLIYRPGFPVTPGGTITVTVGDGGARHSGFPSTDSTKNGQNSVFGTLTAQGGGSGAAHGYAGLSGGSGGGAGRDSNGAAGGQGTQPSQPGESGNYGFGNPGAIDGSSTGSSTGGGGGGAGAAGHAGYANDGNPRPGDASRGGEGKNYSISGSSVGYAGGGSGSLGHPNDNTPSIGYGAGGYSSAGAGEGNGQDATANRGSGGGAGRGPTGYDSGAGGKGIVIVAY